MSEIEKAAQKLDDDASKEDKVDGTKSKVDDEAEPEGGGHDDSVISSPDPYFPPIVNLPEVEVKTGEDEETEIYCVRARLYRYAHECDPPEWKERGTGDIRILRHNQDKTYRIVMRREKTMRLCANHSIQPWMELLKHSNNEKAWVWKTHADFADEVKKPETLAVRFSSVEKAHLWKQQFDKAVKCVLEAEAESYLKEKNSVTSSTSSIKYDKNKKIVTETSEEDKENAGKPAAKVVEKTADDDKKTTAQVTDQLDTLAVK